MSEEVELPQENDIDELPQEILHKFYVHKSIFEKTKEDLRSKGKYIHSNAKLLRLIKKGSIGDYYTIYVVAKE